MQSDSFINNGIAYSIRETIYGGKKPTNFVSKFLNKTFYFIFNLFTSAITQYEFDESVIQLNDFLAHNKYFQNILIIFILIYYLIAFIAPVVFTLSPLGDRREGLRHSCDTGVAWESHIIYGVFAIISFIFELYLYIHTLKKMKHLLPDLKDDISYENKLSRFKSFFIKIFIKFRHY